ncbi:unnamed protein product [Prunus armeniaca]
MGVWYVDSGCNNHATSHESLLYNIDRSVKCEVLSEDGNMGISSSFWKMTLVIELKDGLSDFTVNIYADRELKELVANVPMKGNRCFPMKFEFMNIVMANRATVEDHSWK